jgi:hydrogenase nickel incorporation protein HypA/HybF
VTHELSLLSGLMARVEEVARSEAASSVTRVTVRLGALAGCSPEHLREHFVDAARGTVAEGAELAVDLRVDPLEPHAAEVLLDSVEVEIDA